MCGVVGAIAQRNVVPILLEGLRRLEYRGYDSVGVAVVGEQGLARERSTERVAELVEQTRRVGLKGLTGIGHTRWATMARRASATPTRIFSWPAVAGAQRHHRNHQPLRERLAAQGYVRLNQTPTPEVMVHLIHSTTSPITTCCAPSSKPWPSCNGAYAIA